jgi:hypothetical protein
LLVATCFLSLATVASRPSFKSLQGSPYLVVSLPLKP